MVVLGTTTMPIHQVLRLSRGAIIELDATEADEVKVLANNLPIASGVVLVDRNRIAVEVKQMLPKLPGTRERLSSLFDLKKAFSSPSSGWPGRPSIPETAVLEPRRLWNTGSSAFADDDSGEHGPAFSRLISPELCEQSC